MQRGSNQLVKGAVQNVKKVQKSSKIIKTNQNLKKATKVDTSQHQNFKNPLLDQHYALQSLGMTKTPYIGTNLTKNNPKQLFSFLRLFTPKQRLTQEPINTSNNNIPFPTTLEELNALAKEQQRQARLQYSQSITNLKSGPLLSPPQTIPTKISKFTQLLSLYTRRHMLQSITVAAAADQFEQVRQIKHDFSLTSPQLQKFHDEIVSRRLPFNQDADIEFTLKPEVEWTADSFLGFLKTVIFAPWDAMKYLWSLGIKVYLRLTKKYDRKLTPWVYQLLDLRVPLEDLVFDIKDFSPEEYQLYTLITYILRYQLVIELALKNAITDARFPKEFLTQLEDKADEANMTEDEFKKQLELTKQQFQRSKLRALQHLQLIGVPQDFFPDDGLVELIENFSFPRDFPIEQIIQEPRLGLELIRRLITEQLSQLPMPQMSSLLEIKGLAQALRSLQQPEHFSEYKRLFQFVSTPDMNLRRQLRQLSIQGTSKDYDRVRQSVIKQLQHIRRVIKTYQRQQVQIREFGFIVKRRPNFNQREVSKLSRSDQQVFMEDMQEGLFLTIDEVDPEEEAEGSLIADEPGIAVPERYRVDQRRGGRNNNRLNERRDRRNKRLAENAAPLTEDDMMITLRVLALNQLAQGDRNFDPEAALSDDSHDAELMDQALNRFDGDVRRLERELRPVFYDIKRQFEGGDDDYYDYDDNDDDDYDDDDDEYDDYDPAEGLDPLYDDEYDDEQYLDEHLVPMQRNRDNETDEERIERDRMEQDGSERRKMRGDKYTNDAKNLKNKKNQDGKKKGGKNDKYRKLPAHVMRDPNPKIVSKQWYNEAMQHYGTFQNRLNQIERVIMEKDFLLKDKYSAASRYFANILLDESKERQESLKMQEDLTKYVKGLFEQLPPEIKNDYFSQRERWNNEQKDKIAQKRAEVSKIAPVSPNTDDTSLDGLVNASNANEVAHELPDLSSLSTPAPNTATTTTTTNDTVPFATTTSENIVKTPTGDVVLGEKVNVADEGVTLNDIMNTPTTSDDDTKTSISTTKKIDSTTSSNTSKPTPDTNPSTPTIPHEFPKPANRQEELEQLNEMLQVVQTFQLQAYRNKYLLQEVQRAHKREEMKVLQENDDIIREIQQKEEEEGIKASEEELENNEELKKLREALDNIEIRPTRAMEQRALKRAMQQTELPLVQQLSLARMKTISDVELYNSEMLDIMYNSMRDFLQTALYDAGEHNIIEHSVSGLILSVLNAPKSVESYDNMLRFNEQVEDQVNKPRLTVNKLTTMERKWLLMQLQQEHNLNKLLPLGQLPPVIPFLSSATDQEQILKHDSEFNHTNVGDKDAHGNLIDKYPYASRSLQHVIKSEKSFSEIYDMMKSAQKANIPLDEYNHVPLFNNEIQLQEEVGLHLISEQYDKFIVSQEGLQTDLYDARFEIISQKHLLNQLKRVRDRRLRELLQLIALVGSDPQVLASTTKFHIKSLEPAFHMSGLPEHLIVYLTKYYSHKAIASTLEELIKVLSSMRKQVVDKAIDYSLSEYDVTLQYCMDLYQYHVKQLQAKVPDFYNAQFRALDVSRLGIKGYNAVIKPELLRPLSLKELTSTAFGDQYNV